MWCLVMGLFCLVCLIHLTDYGKRGLLCTLEQHAADDGMCLCGLCDLYVATSACLPCGFHITSVVCTDNGYNGSSVTAALCLGGFTA